MNHVWGLFSHPDREMHVIKSENETVSHHYTHHVLLMAAVAVMGRVIHWMARNYPQRPSLAHCMVFAGYVATPLFLSGIVALYPLVWLCALIGTIALFYTGYLLYLGVPTFLNINKEEGLSFSSSTLAIGVLVLEALLALTVILWGYGYRLF